MAVASRFTFFLSTCAVEYITTKNANRRVMKSAYDTSQRSWLAWATCFFLRLILSHSLQRSEPAQLCSHLNIPTAWRPAFADSCLPESISHLPVSSPATTVLPEYESSVCPPREARTD